MKYKRILLKLSGEALMGDLQWNRSKRLAEYADEIKFHDKGVEAIVIGGGNILGVAGASAGMDRVQGDYNVSNRYQRNGITRFIRRKGMKTRLQTALKMESIAEPYIKRRADRHLEKAEL
jgi:uridylate kinase